MRVCVWVGDTSTSVHYYHLASTKGNTLSLSFITVRSPNASLNKSSLASASSIHPRASIKKALDRRGGYRVDREGGGGAWRGCWQRLWIGVLVGVINTSTSFNQKGTG